MPKVQKQADFLQRLAELEDAVAALQRSGWERAELPFYPTYLNTMPYTDSTSFVTTWETIFSPRTAKLDLGLVFLGDIVSSTNTGGEWQVILADSTVVGTGTVPASYTYVLPTLSIDLAPYRADTQLKVRIQVRRTAGATTGGKFGGGGSIGSAPRYARLL